MAQDIKEYHRAYYQAHKEELKSKCNAYNKAHKEDRNAKRRAYYQAHKEEQKARFKVWRNCHREEHNAQMRDYQKSHKEVIKAYISSNVNSLGQTKHSIRLKSNYYLSKHGTKIPDYQIHHCCTYNEPYKFIYCSKDKHLQIHAYLREHNIDADSNHYEQIKHLLDETVVLYGLE